MNISCDNVSVCKSETRDYGDDDIAEERARAAGWHIWYGYTYGGAFQVVRLCAACVGSHRRRLPPAPGSVEGEQLTLDI